MFENLQQITNTILNIYYASSQREPIKLVVEYIDDIYSRRLELAYNEKQKSDVTISKDFIKSLNGTMVLPQTKDGTYYILISKYILNNTYFIGTIVHELTHIYDFMDFASEFCCDDFEAVEHHELFNTFYYWTEFNSRRKGYYYYRQIQFALQSLKLSDEEQIDHILNTELKVHYDSLLKNLREYSVDNNSQKYIYNLIQFLGRFSVWEDLFPERIKAREYLPDYLLNAYGNKILELYELLCSIDNFSKAKGKLEQFKNTIEALST